MKIGDYMVKWKNVELGKVISLKRGYDLPQQKRITGTIPVFSSSGISGYHNVAMVKGPGVVTGRYGTIGQVFFAKQDFWPLNTTLYVEDFHGNAPEFIYYFLKTLNWNSFMSASAVPGINRNTVHKALVTVPDLVTQKKVASVLNDLDEKIELNNKINVNLLQQSRAILSKWLLDNEGNYEFALLSDIASINPDTYSPKDGWPYVNYLDTSSITDGVISEVQYIKPSMEKLPSRARRIIAKNDVVFSTVRPNQRHFGIIREPLKNMLASTGFAVVRSKYSYVSNELLYLCVTENGFIEKMQQLAEQSTSTFPSIKPSDLGTCEIPCPIDQHLSETLNSIFAYIALNQRENHSLAILRNTLLPRLMSGDLDVSNINI